MSGAESVLKKHKPVRPLIHKDVWDVIWNKYLNKYDRIVFDCAWFNKPLPALDMSLIDYWVQMDYVELFETVLATFYFHPDNKKHIFTTAYLWFSKKILQLISTSPKWEISTEELGYFTRHMIWKNRVDILDILGGSTLNAYYILCVLWRSGRVDLLDLVIKNWKENGWMVNFVEWAKREGNPILLQFLKHRLPHSLTKEELVACAERFFSRHQEELEDSIKIIEESFN